MSGALRVAILGTRGIPAAYGGFETFAEQVGARLAARGHDVTVFCRTTSVARELHASRYRGVRLVVLPAPRSKHLETVVHTLASAWYARRERFDLAIVCNGANFGALPLLRWSGSRTALAVDGIESDRRKWGPLGRAIHRLGARLGPALADVIVADCRVIEEVYRARGARRVARIAYGAEPPASRGTEALERLGVAPGRYVLYVSRLEPENNADLVIRAFRRARLDCDLVLVGDAPYAGAFKRKVRSLAEGEKGIKLAGWVFGRGYDELRAHAACYVQATEVGGTHPALLEAMAAARAVIANDIPEHREVLGDTGWYYRRNSEEDLVRLLRQVLADPDGRLAKGEAARRRAATHYDWEQVASAYESLARRLAAPGGLG